MSKLINKTEQSLIKELSDIAVNLNKPLDEIDESYLDTLMDVFTSHMIDNQSNLNEELQVSLHTLQETRVNSALERLISVFGSHTDINESDFNKKVQHLQYSVDIINEAISKEELTQRRIEISLQNILNYNPDEFSHKSFMNFLSGIKSLQKEKDVIKITTIKNTPVTEITKETNDRLQKYFKDKRIDEIKVKPIDTQWNCYYETNLLLAIKNNHICEQSDLNRIKSLGLGELLTSSIKTIIPRKKHKLIIPLFRVQEKRYQDYLDSRARLIT